MALQVASYEGREREGPGQVNIEREEGPSVRRVMAGPLDG